MLEHYTIVNVQDARKDEAAILDVLAAVRTGKSGGKISLLNYYKEVPISFDAEIRDIDAGVLEVSIHSVQAAAIAIQKATLIRSDRLPHPVVAKVLRLDTKNRIAFLSHLAYASIPSERRKFVRVKVADRVGATFANGAKSVSGHVLDISIGGVAVLAREEVFLEEQPRGTVSLDLKGEALVSECTLVRVGSHNGLFKYVFELNVVNTKSERQISHFINLQQADIVRELKEMVMKW
jgi:c-di-GMP-binding flagellar brake protein YcgR